MSAFFHRSLFMDLLPRCRSVPCANYSIQLRFFIIIFLNVLVCILWYFASSLAIRLIISLNCCVRFSFVVHVGTGKWEYRKKHKKFKQIAIIQGENTERKNKSLKKLLFFIIFFTYLHFVCFCSNQIIV